jgi:uncharacterized MAPEG superfamily protein
MSTELVILGWSVVLLLAQIVIQASLATSELGLGYAMGARDEGRALSSRLAGRADRVLRNFLQTFPAFVALAIGVTVAGKAGGAAAVGAHLYFWARVAYIPAYLLGVAVVRTLIWAVSIVGLVMMVAAFLG